MTEQPVLIPITCPHCGQGIDIEGLVSGETVKCNYCGQSFIFSNPHSNEYDDQVAAVAALPISTRLAMLFMLISALGFWFVEYLKWAVLPQTPLFIISLTIINLAVAVINMFLLLVIKVPIPEPGVIAGFFFEIGYAIHQVLTVLLGLNTYVAVALACPGVIPVIFLFWLLGKIYSKINSRKPVH